MPFEASTHIDARGTGILESTSPLWTLPLQAPVLKGPQSE